LNFYSGVKTCLKINTKSQITANLVLFARNTQLYNRTRIGKVNVKNGVTEVLAMETMSAMPIEDKVAMSLAVVLRKGIESIRTAEGVVAISAKLQAY